MSSKNVKTNCCASQITYVKGWFAAEKKRMIKKITFLGRRSVDNFIQEVRLFLQSETAFVA